MATDVESTDITMSTNHNHNNNHNNNKNNNPQNGFLLNSSSEFIPTTTPKPPSQNNAETPSKTALIGTPSIPNTALKNLSISTPIQNNEEKESEQPQNAHTNIADDCIINDKNAYIAIADNKRLTKISEQYPQKTYTRIQAKNFDKLEEKLQIAMKAMLAKKEKKMLKKSDKEEADENNQEILSNEHKLKIIEKALAACNQQLLYFNKLFLRRIENVNASKPQSNGDNDKKERKAMKEKINGIKSQIEEKQKILMQRIEDLNRLRSQIKKIKIVIPQSVKDKMVKNIEYENDGMNVENVNDGQKEDETRKILAMMNDNKKEKMMDLKAMFDDLKMNEQRLKDKAERIKKKEDLLKKFVALRRKNRIDDEQNNEKVNNRNNRVSMASSIGSTIHGSVSPFIFNQDQKGELDCFKALREIEDGNVELYGGIDIDL